MLYSGTCSGEESQVDSLPGQMHKSKDEKTQVDSDKGKGCLKGTHKHRLGGDPDEATIYLPAENRNIAINPKRQPQG